jgi:hypothetical protein
LYGIAVKVCLLGTLRNEDAMQTGKSQCLTLELLGFLSHRQDPFMVILNSFWDESGKFNDHKVISFCGVGLSIPALGQFEDKWKELLRRNEIDFLKMSEALCASKPLSAVIPAQTSADRIEALKPFAACLFESFEIGVALAVNVEAYTRTPQHIKKSIGGKDPFYFSFLNGVMLIARYVQDDDKISFVCDDDEGAAETCLKMYRKMKILDKEWKRKLSAITFANDHVFVALQAADMLSSLVRLQANYEFFSQPYDYEPLFAYLGESRGPRYIQWKVCFVGELKMAKIECGWRRKDEQIP